MSRHISLDDHAFASGPVFLRPQSFIDALRRTCSWLEARRLRAVWHGFDAGAIVGEKVRLGGGARLINRNTRESTVLGAESVIRGILRVEAQGRLTVGSFVYIGDGTIVSAMENVEIGDGTLLAHGVQVFDNDTHPVDAEERVADFRKKLGYKLPKPITIGRAPVRIGKRCWLGMNTIVMKGVTIGDDAIVASGSLVVSDVPAGVIVAGNPARIVKHIQQQADDPIPG